MLTNATISGLNDLAFVSGNTTFIFYTIHDNINYNNYNKTIISEKYNVYTKKLINSTFWLSLEKQII